MLIVTTENIQGQRVEKVIGLVFGVSVRSRNLIGNMMGDFKAIFGGKQTGYASMITENRTDAMKDMIERAKQLGANAIIMARFDSNEFGGGKWHAMSEVVVTGLRLSCVPNNNPSTWGLKNEGVYVLPQQQLNRTPQFSGI